VAKSLTNISVPGRPGVIPGVRADKTAPTVTLVVKTPGANLQTLYTVLNSNNGLGTLALEDDATRAATFELASITPSGRDAYDATVIVSFTLRFPTADWRDVSRTDSGSQNVSTAVQEFEVFDGITSDILDADIFVGGDFGDFEILDVNSGAWLHTTTSWTHTSGTGLLYVGSTGQVYRADASDPWTPTATIGGIVSASGGGFRISPYWDSDPTDTTGLLELTTTDQSGVTFRVRGYNAYDLRDGSI
jgi:hypothetical protein